MVQNGPWQGENTIATFTDEGGLLLTGLAINLVKDDETVEVLNIKLRADAEAIGRYVASLANRPDLITAAEAKSLTPKQYVSEVLDRAAEKDIGMFEVLRIRI